ncbi:MAG: T9SS C-terminal target domain-containing protein, partial [Flavobacteriales bacterium]|nr:T9SS C-terminal target domain-containing protein [Flavobacteriales bacterium]
MKLFKALFLGILVATISTPASAYKYIGPGATDEGSNEANTNVGVQTRAAACAPASGLRDLEWNNVRSLIETGGSLWQDRANSIASYIVPADGDNSVLYAGSLWLGGLSPDQQLKLAAITFRANGNDFWTGPLTNDGSAEIDELTCDEYDRFFVSLRADSQRHRQYHDCINDPDCDLETEFPEGYVMPGYFEEYPAHGNTALLQDFYLSPFYDYDGDGFYNPSSGDYPWYDFLQEINCEERRRTDPVPLFGDQTYYWIFNDKGNVHSESQGEPIGMEIRAQAFAFATNDEINNMTFLNYVLINQGTQTLTETYFGTWIDADVGLAFDDYVGCDVQRGLGYAYNGVSVDPGADGASGYGENPPAIGVDFFEGPYQDEDGIDNPLTTDFSDAQDSLGIPYRGIGIGYGDEVIDNERFGMRKFLYYNNSGNSINGEPSVALDYYNYLKGFWKNGQRMAYGGDGLNPNLGADLSIEADYMFPGDTDPFAWGTQGTPVEPWTEVSSGNPPNDRRFMQSSGPFTLEPGDFNNITVGMVFGRATAGDPFESVKEVQRADDKAQALFDNCFEIVSGPDAPDVTIQELDREIILYLTNDNPLSNNFEETRYDEDLLGFDPIIPESPIEGLVLDSADRAYKFQGYQIYQLSDATVSPSDLGNIEKARLIFQCDIKDGLSQAINYTLDLEMGLPVPELMVNGADEGIQHSFRVTNDAFASGDTRLINHRTYYFMALAYGVNDYLSYDPATLVGQDVQYKASRKGAVGAIKVYSGIPHNISPEAGGTTTFANYGDGIAMTRIEGRGNGLNNLEITEESEAEILANNFATELHYEAGGSPVSVKVVDPTRLPSADFDLRLAPDDTEFDEDSARWILTNLTSGEEYTSKKAFTILNEELLLDWGISVTWNQYEYLDEDGENLPWFTDFLSGSIEYEDPTRPWLQGVQDEEGFTELNWIRAGNQASEDVQEELIFDDSEPGSFWDEEEVYEGVLNGTWSPYCLVSYTDEITTQGGDEITAVNVAPTIKDLKGDLSAPPNQYRSNIKGLNNVDIVLTSDKSKWTRCAVFEAQGIPELTDTGNGEKLKLRQQASVDKNGKTVSQGGNANEANFGGQNIGMSWFPGYAIDV